MAIRQQTVHLLPGKRSARWLLPMLAVALGGCTMGVPELLIILGIVVVLFGATRLPALGRALGETVRSFKESTSDKDAVAGKDADSKLDDKQPAQIEDAKVEPVDDKKA
jgi:sec-independent protein translocase protein TatA